MVFYRSLKLVASFPTGPILYIMLHIYMLSYRSAHHSWENFYLSSKSTIFLKALYKSLFFAHYKNRKFIKRKGVESMKVRQDAWTDEDDLLLAETVLRHVREGSTQLNAFEEVGDQLNRTSAACGFRWNAVVRYSYEQALQLAKNIVKIKCALQAVSKRKTFTLYTTSFRFDN